MGVVGENAMTPHTHQPHLLADIPLGLPTTDASGTRIERYLYYVCACGWYQAVDGDFLAGQPFTHQDLLAFEATRPAGLPKPLQAQWRRKR